MIQADLIDLIEENIILTSSMVFAFPIEGAQYLCMTQVDRFGIGGISTGQDKHASSLDCRKFATSWWEWNGPLWRVVEPCRSFSVDSSSFSTRCMASC